MSFKKFCFLILTFCVLSVSVESVSAATLSLSPSSDSYTVGDIFNVKIILDTQGQSADGVDIFYLNFPQNYLKAINITPGSLFGNTITNVIDNDNGKIKLAQVSPGSNYSGSGTFATIQFEAKAQGTANLSFNYTSNSTTDCNVASSGFDILSSVSGASYSISPGDTTGPVISNVQASNITFNSAVITWTTDEPSTSRVDYGTSVAYGSYEEDANLVTSHTISLSGLGADTEYHYKVLSVDGSPNQNQSSSVDKTFKTLGLPDTTAPYKISDLSCSDVAQTSAKLSWTAPGDDGNSGTASEYDIRYSHSLITDLNFSSANQCSGEPLPQSAGSSQSYTAVGLQSGETYYFAMKTADEVPNWSFLSNVVQIETLFACSFTYSNWSECQPDGTQHRTVLTRYPEGCSGGSPILTQNCDYVQPTCSSFTYSEWGECQPDNTQRRTALTSFPAGCSAGNPILSQDCEYTPEPGPTCESFTYSEWGACQQDSVQSRTILSSSPDGCDGGNPILAQDCVYSPGAETCTSFTYYDWSECQPNGTQYRTVRSSLPAGCSGGDLVLTQECVYISTDEETDTTSPAQPKNFKLLPADKQIMLIWENPKDNDFVRVKILRKIGSSPSFYNDSSAVVVYEGDGEQYTDINLDNTATYYYAIFAYDNVPNYSNRLVMSAQPEAGAESVQLPQTDFEATQMSISELKERILEILTQIAKLQALLVQMKGGEAIYDIPAGFQFNNPLKLGMRHQDVVYLKILLNNEVEHSAWTNSDYFGSKTLSAVKAFQRKYRDDISEIVGYEISASGYVGMGTRVKLNEILEKSEAGE